MKYLIILFSIFVITSCGASKKFTSDKQIEYDHSSELSFDNFEFFEQGIASYYAEKYHGRKTASGETYDMNDFTAAHPTLPFGIVLLVINIQNEKSVVVRVNDRMPDFKGRVIDLSLAAAKKIDMIKDGITEVKIYKMKR